MEVRLEEDHPSIVLVGGFDPPRFQPQWFRSQKLLREGEADQAEIRVIADQLADWSTEWFDLQVTRNRMIVIAKVESRADSLRDLCVGTFQLLEHLRVTAMGLNRTMHLDVGGKENCNRIGDALAPKDVWREHLTSKPGLLSLQIQETTRTDGLSGQTIINIQPSQKYLYGVFFDVNNDIRSENGADASAGFFVDIIEKHWQRLLDRARSMAEDVLRKAAQ